MPIYTDRRTGKKVIQYQIGWKYVPDKSDPGRVTKRPKYKTEVIGKSARVAKRVLTQREAEWERIKYQDEIGEAEAHSYHKFSELVSWYLELPATKKKKSYRKDVERAAVLLGYFGDMRADKIKPSMVESFQHTMLATKSRYGKPYKPGTINRMLALMKRIYNLAIREDMVQKNPCWKVTMLAENNKRDRILTPEEYGRLLAALPPHQRPIVQVAYLTGMRQSEILGLTWSRVNLEQGYLDLRAEDTKTAEPRRIYFNKALVEVFSRISKIRSLHHDHVFIYRGKPLKEIRTGFKKACAEAGIDGFVFHDLRHTFNTNMRKAGVDRSVIMKLTGHKTSAMFDRYNTVDQEDAELAMQRFESFLRWQNSDESSDHVQTTPLPAKN